MSINVDLYGGIRIEMCHQRHVQRLSKSTDKECKHGFSSSTPDHEITRPATGSIKHAQKSKMSMSDWSMRMSTWRAQMTAKR